MCAKLGIMYLKPPKISPPNITPSVYKPIKLLTFTQTKLRHFKALRLEVNKAFAGKVKACLHRLGIEIPTILLLLFQII